MPVATTCRGYPYPLDSDHINTAGDIQALAEAIDADLCNGIGGGSPSRIYDGVAYPPRGDVDHDSTVFWINHVNSILPGVGGDGAVAGVDVVFVFNPAAP